MFMGVRVLDPFHLLLPKWHDVNVVNIFTRFLLILYAVG